MFGNSYHTSSVDGFVSQFTNVMLEVVEKVSKTPTRDEIITFIIIRGFCEKKTPFYQYNQDIGWWARWPSHWAQVI